MIIELNNEIKCEIIKVVLDNNGGVIRLSHNNTTKMLIQLRNAISKQGYSLDDIDEQAVIFEVYDNYKLDVNGITGYNSDGKWFSFGLLYDFTNFTEDIDSIYLIDEDGSDYILVL